MSESPIDHRRDASARGTTAPTSDREEDSMNVLADFYKHTDDYTTEELEHLQQRADAILEGHSHYACDGQERAQHLQGSQASWHRFYTANANKFFKDRRYVLHEFPVLYQALSSTGDAVYPDGITRVLEVGCGTGSTIFPLLRAPYTREQQRRVCIDGIDFAASAVAVIESQAEYQEALQDNRCHVACHDIVTGQPPVPFLTRHAYHFVTLFFVLSAIAPEHHELALCRMTSLLAPGGKLLFRDYGEHDMSMLRFPAQQKLSQSHYVRGDGTQSYFFTLAEVTALCHKVGLHVEEINYARRKLENRKKGITMHRVWVHAIASKPKEG